MKQQIVVWCHDTSHVQRVHESTWERKRGGDGWIKLEKPHRSQHIRNRVPYTHVRAIRPDVTGDEPAMRLWELECRKCGSRSRVEAREPTLFRAFDRLIDAVDQSDLAAQVFVDADGVANVPLTVLAAMLGRVSGG